MMVTAFFVCDSIEIEPVNGTQHIHGFHRGRITHNSFPFQAKVHLVVGYVDRELKRSVLQVRLIDEKNNDLLELRLDPDSTIDTRQVNVSSSDLYFSIPAPGTYWLRLFRSKELLSKYPLYVSAS